MPNQGNDPGGPVRYSHPERLASRCGHRLHPSSPRFPYCMRCILSKAKDRLFEAHLRFQKLGGLSAPADVRDRTWHRAHLVQKLAERQIGRASRLHAAHKQRILDWVGFPSISICSCHCGWLSLSVPCLLRANHTHDCRTDHMSRLG